jgi:hypothetical protein
MKKLRYPIASLILVALLAAGVWAIRVVNSNEEPQIVDAATASSSVDAATRDMAVQSDLIVTGRCLDTRTEWIEGGRVLVTLATVAVDEVIKGAQASTVTVVLPGGADLNRRIPVAMTYAGAPTMASQEEVFLFLTADERVGNGYAVMGFAQGKLSIIQNEDGEKLVSRDLTKVRGNTGPGIVRGNRQFVTLSTFKAKVRGYLGQ